MTKAMQNPRAPHNQAFNLNGSKCRSKARSWWNPSSPTYFANRKKKVA